MEILPSGEQLEREWEGLDPGFVVQLETPGDWADLRDLYGSGCGRSADHYNLDPWHRCLATAAAAGARSVVVETRYICTDYRSEFAAFYSQVHAPAFQSAHRLHFFETTIHTEQIAELPEDPQYLGYIVCRPPGLELVGRTMLAPPRTEGSDGWILTLVEESVTLYGQRLTVEAVPFMQQDRRLGVCAHVNAWIHHFTAHLRGDVDRRPYAEFVLDQTTRTTGSVIRPIAPRGLDLEEWIDLLDRYGFRCQWHRIQPAIELPPPLDYPWSPEQLLFESDVEQPASMLKRRLSETICRTLNSGLPLYVGTGVHAYTICGYARVPIVGGSNDLDGSAGTAEPQRKVDHPTADRLESLPGGPAERGAGATPRQIAEIAYICHDDEAGPYLWQDDPESGIPPLPLSVLTVPNESDYIEDDELGDYEDDWEYLVMPFPARVFLPLDEAETAGLLLFATELLELEVSNPAEGMIDRDILTLRDADLLSRHTYLITANEFKLFLVDRQLPPELLSLYRLARFARYIVVVELHDASKVGETASCVGEVVFDATSGERNPWDHVVHIGSRLRLRDSNGVRTTRAVQSNLYTSGGAAFR